MTRWIRTGLITATIAAVAIAATLHLRATGAVNSQIVLKVNATGTKAVGLSTIDDPVVKDYTQLFSSGTGANQTSNLYHAQTTLTASASTELDMTTGLTNAFGVALNFTKLKVVLVRAAAANTNDVVVGNESATPVNIFNATTDRVFVKPGGTLVLIAPDVNGWTVDGTHKFLKLTNSAAGTSVTFDIIIMGVD